MYMSKKKFDEIKAKHSTTIVVVLTWVRLWLLSRTCWKLRRTQSKTASRTQLHLSDA